MNLCVTGFDLCINSSISILRTLKFWISNSISKGSICTSKIQFAQIEPFDIENEPFNIQIEHFNIQIEPTNKLNPLTYKLNPFMCKLNQPNPLIYKLKHHRHDENDHNDWDHMHTTPVMPGMRKKHAFLWKKIVLLAEIYIFLSFKNKDIL